MIKEPDIIRGVRENNPKEVLEALKANPECINHQDKNDLTASHWVAMTRNYAIAEILFSQTSPRADLSMKDEWGRDALDLAFASSEDNDFMELFTQHRFAEQFKEELRHLKVVDPDEPTPMG